eukprot:1818191-Prymnesium_polylepis.1
MASPGSTLLSGTPSDGCQRTAVSGQRRRRMRPPLADPAPIRCNGRFETAFWSPPVASLELGAHLRLVLHV